MNEWCYMCVCVSRRSDIHTITTVTLNVVHNSMKSCVVGRVFTGIQMGFYERILETFLFLILLILSQLPLQSSVRIGKWCRNFRSHIP